MSMSSSLQLCSFVCSAWNKFQVQLMAFTGGNGFFFFFVLTFEIFLVNFVTVESLLVASVLHYLLLGFSKMFVGLLDVFEIRIGFDYRIVNNSNVFRLQKLPFRGIEKLINNYKQKRN